MKRPTRPTRKQKEAISAARLNPDDWYVIQEMVFYLKIINRETSKIKMIDKLRKGR